MNGSVLYLKYLLEVDSSTFKNLDDAAKMNLIVQMIKRKTIIDFETLNKGLAMIGWDQRVFMDKFKSLWKDKKIGWDELDALDSNGHLFKGPGIFSDRWLLTNIGQKELCDRIPPGEHDDISYCKGYGAR